MLSHEDNERLTRVGPGTPMGTLMRRYWVPVVFSDRIAEPDSPPVRVRLLCEDLVAFRDTAGRVGLVDERCPHRTASLFFGRNEEGGLRCVYHGIKFDVDGNCVDVPCLPPGTPEGQLAAVKRQLRVRAYPCGERGGIVWAYMGPPEHQPEFPELEWVGLPAGHRYATRHIQECNWLQGVEGGFDPTHLTFLHGGANESDGGANRFSHRTAPEIYDAVRTDSGFLFGAGRRTGRGTIAWHVNMLLLPFHKIIASKLYAAHMWVPVDDETTMLYSINFDPARPFTDEDLKRELSWDGIHTENIAGSERAVHNRDNDYLIDRTLQASGASFTGIKGFGIQDCAIQESMGRMADREREHLLVSDSAIARLRRLLLAALDDLEAGRPLPGLRAADYRVRSARYEAPEAAAFADTVMDHIRPEPVGAGSSGTSGSPARAGRSTCSP